MSGRRGVLLIGACCLASAVHADVSETHALDADVTEVSFEAQRGRLEVVEGDEPGLVLEARDAEVLAGIEVEIADGRLTLRRAEDSSGWFVWGRDRITARVVVRSLDAVAFGGSGDVVVSGVDGGLLRVSIAGTADCRLEGLEVETLTLEIAGASDCSAEGSAREQRVSIAGAGDYHGFELATERTEVQVAGAGDVHVRVSDELQAEVAGFGGVEYLGSPELHEDVAGWGSVERVGGP